MCGAAQTHVCGHVSGIYLPVPDREGIWRLAAAAGGRRVPASEPWPLLQSAPPHWLLACWWLGSCSWQSGLSRAVVRDGRQLGSCWQQKVPRAYSCWAAAMRRERLFLMLEKKHTFSLWIPHKWPKSHPSSCSQGWVLSPKDWPMAGGPCEVNLS